MIRKQRKRSQISYIHMLCSCPWNTAVHGKEEHLSAVKTLGGFPRGSTVTKNWMASAGDPRLIRGLGRSHMAQKPRASKPSTAHTEPVLWSPAPQLLSPLSCRTEERSPEPALPAGEASTLQLERASPRTTTRQQPAFSQGAGAATRVSK